jgi:hypothetical protein
MSIVKRSDGSLLFFNAMPLEPAALEEVRGWGKPEVLVVPHDQHMIDADAFAKKLELAVYGPKECETKMRTRTEMTGMLEALPVDPVVKVESVPGVKNGEPALLVTSAGGQISLLVSDVLMNNSKESLGFFPRLLGFAGPAKIVPVFKMMFLQDKAALKAQLGTWAALPGMTRVVPCHGAIFAAAVPDALRAAAGTL